MIQIPCVCACLAIRHYTITMLVFPDPNNSVLPPSLNFAEYSEVAIPSPLVGGCVLKLSLCIF